MRVMKGQSDQRKRAQRCKPNTGANRGGAVLLELRQQDMVMDEVIGNRGHHGSGDQVDAGRAGSRVGGAMHLVVAEVTNVTQMRGLR